MNKSPSLYDKTQTGESEIDQIQNQQSFSKLQTNQKQLSQEKSNDSNKKNEMISMDRFCYQFCKDYHDKTNEIVCIKDLTERYGVKNRRVYDLLGILEGLNFINKVSKKSTYLWMGSQVPRYEFNFQQNKSIALKDIACLIKILLKNCRHGLTIKQLNQKILYKIQQKTKRKMSRNTIARRIYQCVNVMKIIGMIHKIHNTYLINVCQLKNPSFQYFKSMKENSVENKNNQIEQKKVLNREQQFENCNMKKIANIIIGSNQNNQ